MKKIFLFSDSRGYHKPNDSSHKIYSQRLAEHAQIDLTSFVCPFKWTTIPDFLHLVNSIDLTQYDHVVLHAGIVDHSPRPQDVAINGVYNPSELTENPEEILEKGEFSRLRIVNRKKIFLDEIFGEQQMLDHLNNTFDVLYEGQPTVNLYSLEMLAKGLIPKLQEISNLLFIGSNNFCLNWNGDYPRERPKNISIIEQYSEILCANIPHSIDLAQWNSEDVKRYTCDNLHLSAHGSAWIYERVLEAIGLKPRNYKLWKRSFGVPKTPCRWPLDGEDEKSFPDSIKMLEPTRLTKAKSRKIRQILKLKDGPVATIIIGMRAKEGDPSRLENIYFLLDWFKYFYADLFDIIVVEQDSVQLFDKGSVPAGVRYRFIYNPAAYNRGWLYNVAVAEFTDNKVVAFCDTDILPGNNFLQCIIDCHGEYNAISPNRSLYYSTEEEKKQVYETRSFKGLKVSAESLKNPTSFAGGMLIMKRQYFMDIGGFEQYVGYGCEDRALDVTLLELLPEGKLRMDSHAYFHQHHQKHKEESPFFDDIYSHLVRHYGCEYYPSLHAQDYIHKLCNHDGKQAVEKMIERRKAYVGDPGMYRVNSKLTVNGLPPQTGGTIVPISVSVPVFPQDDVVFDEYKSKEEFEGKYAGGWAPPPPPDQRDPDTEELRFFYNRFKGKRCFIIGNGPSLNKHNLSFLKNEYSFGVNSFYYKTRETGFCPTFYVVEDSSVLNENIEEIRAFEAPFKFFPTIYKKLHPKAPGTYFFRLNRGFYEKGSPNYAVPRFSMDISDRAFCGQSVTYINLQLAYYMGFAEVYLIGMDFSYQIPDSHQRTGDVLLSDTDDPNHFHKDYFGKGKTWKDPKLDRVLMNYKMAKLVYECAGRKIYNATVGGHLEEFERINYEGLFSGLDRSLHVPPLDLTRPSISVKKAPSKASTKDLPVKSQLVNFRSIPPIALPISHSNTTYCPTGVGGERFQNIMDIFRTVDFSVINGFYIKPDPIDAESLENGTVKKFSISLSTVLPPFEVKEVSLVFKSGDTISAVEKNVHRSDWGDRQSLVPSRIQGSGFIFKNIPLKGYTSFDIQAVNLDGSRSSVGEAILKRKAGGVEVEILGESTHPSDIWEGDNGFCLQIQNPGNDGNWTKNMFTSGWVLHNKSLPVCGLRLKLPKNIIAVGIHRIQSAKPSMLFGNHSVYSEAGFKCPLDQLEVGVSDVVFEARLQIAQKQRSDWLRVFSCSLERSRFGNKIRLLQRG